MKKLLLVVIGCLFLVGVPFKADASEVNTKNITSIEEPTWIFNSGMTKGKNHDRQDLGFVLGKGKILKVRQSNPAFNGNLTIRLLGDDSAVEKSVSVGSQWKTITSTEDLVPFVDTPYGAQTATLEYSVDDSIQTQKILPVYSLNENQEEYFKLWNEQDAEYALIKGEDFQLLLPKRDKILAENLNDFASLNELIIHYEDIFSYYNQMAGFDNSSSSNQKGSNRYFLKADKHGSGGAYYGNNWTANTANTTDMWLKKISWGALHEIAHGYQTGFDGRGMYTGEVSNNIFAAQYQYEKYGKDADKFGWLFNHGKKNQVEGTLYDKMIKNNGTYDSVDLREKLILLMMLKQKAGNDSFTKMYQAYREQASKDGFNNEDYTLPDLLNYHYSENSQLDFTPVLERWNLSLSNSQTEINRAKEYTAVASLADVVPESELVRAKTLIDPTILINSNFEMITNDEIAPLGLNGSLTVTLKTQNISELLGMKIQLKNGKNIVKEEVIKGEEITFSNVPNGVYTVEFTGKEIPNLSIEQHYLYVKEANNTGTISIEKMDISNLANQTIRFLGLSNNLFGEFKTNLNANTASFSIVTSQPHQYYEGETYASIKVSNSNGLVVYEKVIQGTKAEVMTDNIPLSEGDKIEIFHDETKNRLTSNEKIIDTTNKTNTWIVTKTGLKNEKLADNPETNLISKIDKKAKLLKQEPALWNSSSYQSNEKKNLRLAIEMLSEPTKTQYKGKYSELFPASHPENGELFSYTFKGVRDAVFATMDISLKDNQAIIDTKNKQPQRSFGKKVYAYITIQNKEGVEKYARRYEGNKKYPITQDKVPLAIGDYITAYHAENQNNLMIQNNVTKEKLEQKETVTYQVTENGLKMVETNTIPKPRPEHGNLFNYTFKGLRDVVFATMDISLKDNQAVINTKNKQPQRSFGNKIYASITIQDKDGVEKYAKKYVGKKSYPAAQDKVPLAIGDYIIVYHAENQNHLMIQNQVTKEKLEQKENVTYQVTENGLRLL